MKKIFRAILAIITAIILGYSVLWFVILVKLSSTINQKYANSYISTKSDNQENDDNNEYFIKFSKVKPSGFPFKFAVSIINGNEENINRKVEFNSPINIGYDLLNQYLFIEFSGEAIGRFKPIERGFGAKFDIDNFILSARIPLSFELLKILRQEKNLFEVINFIKNVKFNSGKVQITDLIEGYKLYEEDHTKFSLTFDKTKYYTSSADFLSNIPQKLEIDYETEITASNIENRIIPAGILLYRFAWPEPFKFTGNFTIKTSVSDFKDLAKDLEIKVNNASIASNNFENNTDLLYKGKLGDGLGENDIILRIDSQTKLKQHSIKNLLDNFKKYIDKQKALLNLSGNQARQAYQNLDFILDHSNDIDFTIFENRTYNFNLDINLVSASNRITNAQSTKAKINDLSLYSGTSGFYLTNESTVNLLKNSYSKGIIILNNYARLIDVLSPFFYKMEKLQGFSDESKKIYQQALKEFLKTISDHPKSSSGDISFEYEFDFMKSDKTKIGTVDDINKIIPLYYLSIYKSALENIKAGDNIKDKMQELIPNFDKHQKILEQFGPPKFQEINENLWHEITEQKIIK